MSPVVVEITFPTLEEAEKIANELVKRKLIACANILDARSIYPWKGKIESENERVLFAKTDLSNFDAIKAYVQRPNHSYEVPCVLAFAVVDGNESYMKWFYENLDRPMDITKVEPAA